MPPQTAPDRRKGLALPHRRPGRRWPAHHDFFANYGFHSDDLEGWDDRILVIESDNDPSVKDRERSALRALYPQARVHTFQGTGHGSAILAVDAYVELVKDFLLEDPAPRPPLPKP